MNYLLTPNAAFYIIAGIVCLIVAYSTIKGMLNDDLPDWTEDV